MAHSSAVPTIIVTGMGCGGLLAGHSFPLGPDEFVEPEVLQRTLALGVSTGLPVLAVLSPVQVQRHSDLSPQIAIVVLEERALLAGGAGAMLAAGVAATPQAAGWVLVPGDRCEMQPETVACVARALQTYAVAYACHAGQRGQPLGFAAELYSELIYVPVQDACKHLSRLAVRFPAHVVDVNDPAVLHPLQRLGVSAKVGTPRRAPASVARRALGNETSQHAGAVRRSVVR